MSRKAADPIQVVGVIVLMVIVVLALAIFFFTGLSQQGGVISESAGTISSNLSRQVNQSITIDIFG